MTGEGHDLEDEPGGDRPVVVSHLQDKDPVPWIAVGLLTQVVVWLIGLLVMGGAPGPGGQEAVPEPTVVEVLAIVETLAWVPVFYGVVILAAKVDDIWAMLRRQRDADDG